MSSTSPVVAGIADLCRRFEGFRAKPYLCPAGVATIGYGATTYLDGRPVQLKDRPISQSTADALLIRQIEQIYLPGVLRLCPGLPDAAQIAAGDFAFNLGLSRLAGSTLRKRLMARDWPAAVSELRKWVRGGGKVLPGLVLRREAEAQLLLDLL